MDYFFKQEEFLVNIEINDLHYSYGGDFAIHDITVQIPEGVNALLGPNGSGKTTLLKSISGLLPFQGKITFGGNDVLSLKKDELESLISFLPQYPNSNAVLTSFETILLGRINSLKWTLSESDFHESSKIMEDLGILHLSDSYINELSGGQRQMVFIAQALVKNPRILLLDEPTSSLDIHHQLELFDLIRLYIRQKNISVIATLHDINLATQYADKIFIMQNGRLDSSGVPKQVINAEMLSRVYRFDAEILYDEFHNPVILPKKATSKNQVLDELNSAA
jgi:iron complex transport system ATP-binding protein